MDIMWVSIHGGSQKWVVYDRKKTIEMDDSGVPLFVETFLYIFTYNGDVSPEYITCT